MPDTTVANVLPHWDMTPYYPSPSSDAFNAAFEQLKQDLDLDFLKEDSLALLSESCEGVQRVRNIVQDLKDFSHVDAAEWQMVDLHKGLDSTLNIAHNEIKYKAEIIREYGDVPLVECLPSQLNQVFMNMFVNAVHAIEENGKITIRTGRVDASAWIEIEDTGKGIAPEHLSRIFDPFFTTKPVGKGTGLGLSQIFGFAHQSGGEVGIESEVGKGTTVSLYLPRSTAEAPVRLHPPAQRMSEDERVPGARILVVEDDPRVRSSTVEALQDLDYDPIACSSGEEAIELFDNQKFDLVISDVIMPEMTGPELIRTLKQKRSDFAVLFVTGYVGEGESENLIGHELLRKPFTVGGLASAVATALAQANEPRRTSGAAAAR